METHQETDASYRQRLLACTDREDRREKIEKTSGRGLDLLGYVYDLPRQGAEDTEGAL